MPPPKSNSAKKRSKRNTELLNSTAGYRSMPTTPNQERHTSISQQNEESDSDTACGFDTNWKQATQ